MDEMRLESKFTTMIASKFAKKMVRDKLGYDVDIRLNRLRTTVSSIIFKEGTDVKAKPALFQRAGKAFKKATPTILTCISAAGVVVTVALAVKATPKALKCIEKEKEVKNAENGENLTRMETIAACWRCYIPAAATGIATIGCIFGANALNRRQQASLVSAYALASRSFNSYKQKVRSNFANAGNHLVSGVLAMFIFVAALIQTAKLYIRQDH